MLRNSKNVLGESQNLTFAVAVMAYTIANLVWWLQPALVNEIMLRYQVGEARSGLVAGIEMTAIALSSVLTG